MAWTLVYIQLYTFLNHSCKMKLCGPPASRGFRGVSGYHYQFITSALIM